MNDLRIDMYFPGGDLVVDLGCGDGSWIDSVQQRYSRAIGIDLELPQPGSRGGTALTWEFIQSDLNSRIPLPDSCADAVLANQVIEHVANPLHLFNEAHRLLRPGGAFVVTTPNIRYIRHLLRLAIAGQGPLTSGARQRTLTEWDDGHIHFLTARDLDWLGRASGFSAVETVALVSIENDRARIRRILNRMRARGLVKGLLAGNVMAVAWK